MPAIIKRSLVIAGHQTSISLEEPFWRLLKHCAANADLSVAAMVAQIDRERQGVNLSSAIRVHLLEWVMETGNITLDSGP